MINTTHFLNLRDQLCSVETQGTSCAHRINLRDQYYNFAKDKNQHFEIYIFLSIQNNLVSLRTNFQNVECKWRTINRKLN